MKKCFIIWFLTILALLVADVKTGSPQDKDAEPRRCYHCPHGNKTSACERLDDMSPVICTAELPYCATTAKSPDFHSSMTCAAGSQMPCRLISKTKDKYEITCICTGHLCNAPFSREMQNELLNFSTTNSAENMTDGLTEMFINTTAFANVDSANLYEAMTVAMIRETTKVPMMSPMTPRSSTGLVMNSERLVPRAEALKHEATVPPDDDEDESEGSGADDARAQAPAAPAAPSSFLPANENNASPIHMNLLVTIPFISLYTIA